MFRLAAFTLLVSLTVTAAAASVTFVQVPGVLPRDTPAPNYSPLVVISYSDLDAQTYTLRIHLLETQTGSYNCGCASLTTMWCNAAFVIDNSSGTNAAGTIVDARSTNVNNYTGFLWVADLYNQAGTKIFTAQQSATSTTNRAPVLAPIGFQNANEGQSIDFTVSATDAENDAFALSASNLPAGATFNSGTGAFHWEPSTAGTYGPIRFAVTQSASPLLSDAELVTIEVGEPQPAGELAFSVSTHTVGEAGPTVLTVTRANATSATVTVQYATSNGTATAGADYTTASGTLTFGANEASETIRVAGINDGDVESNETFQVQLSNPTNGATLGTPSSVTVTIVDDDDPELAGDWSSVQEWPVVPIHMHLLPTGKVMFWDRHNESPMWDGTPRLWDPNDPMTFTTLPEPGWDLFCSGHSFLADGRLLVTGGHEADFVGEEKAGIYDAISNSWTAVPDMNDGRWYPTNTTLANGDVLVVAGTRNEGDTNPLPQVWQSGSNTWRDLTNALLGGLYEWPDFYPFLYAAPNGKVFVAGPQQTARYLDTSGTGVWTEVGDSSLLYRDYGTSVLYDDGKVLIAGGNPRDVNPALPVNLPSAVAEVIDLGAATPAWRTVSPMSIGRRHLSSTILPDGTILVTGGSSLPGLDDANGAVLYGELWDPATETWTPMAAHTRYRGYHSNALLLPDARVLVAGGGHPNAANGTEEDNAEIYSPPYLFHGPRPVITSAPATVTYGETFTVGTPDASEIEAVNWIRLGSVTHAFNQNQRINRLSFSADTNALDVTAPATGNLCPPGDYMLFLLDDDGVPSIAKIIRIGLPSLQIDTVAPPAGRMSGGQQITLTGDFAGLTTVEIGGVAATWSFSNGTSEIIVTTPAHAAGAVSIELTPSYGEGHTKPNAFAYLRTTFTDNTIVANTTVVKIEHVLELRAMAEVLRAIAGQAAPSWTDPSLTPLTTPIKAVHIAQLRTNLEAAAIALGYSAVAYTDAPINAGLVIKRLHIEELRQRIRDIAD